MKKANDSLKAQSGNIPLIVPYFLSTFTSMLSLTFAGYLEVWILGSGPEATNNLAANGVVAALQTFITAVAYMLAMGTGCVVAEDKEKKELSRGSVGVGIALVVGIIFTVVANFLPSDWTFFLGAKKENYDMVYGGIRLLSFGWPALLVVHVFGTALRSCGKKLIASVGLTFMGIMQVLVACFGVYYGMNSFYAVIVGYLIAQYLTLIFFTSFWIYFLLRQKKRGLKQLREEICLRFISENLEQVCKAGLPSLARQASIAVGIWGTNLVAGVYGIKVQSLMTATGRFMALPLGVIIAVCQAYQPIAGRNMEDGEADKEEYLIARRFGIWVMILVSVLLLFWRGRILAFVPGAVDEKSASIILLSQIVALPFLMYGQFVVTHFQVCKEWKAGVLLASMRNALIFLPVLFIFSAGFGELGLYVTQGFVDILVCLIAFQMMKRWGHFEK